MKQKALSLALVLAALATPIFTRPARAEVEVSFDYFYDALSPFGDWIKVGDYGLCWRPTGVAEDWTPYSDGYWAYTDAGWTWVSYEDWGGITYHYGRWVHVRDEGWVWVPEYQWGPAWVSWRSSDDYVGWAPLPPEAHWEESTGFSTWVDTSYDIGPDNYRFCHTRDFGSPFLAPVLLPCERNVTIILSTVNITNICYNHESTVVFCGGPNFVNINRHCFRPVPALRLVCEDRAPRDDHGHAPPQVLRGNQLAVYAPKVTRPVDTQAFPAKPRRVVPAEKINRGWGRVPEVAAQQEIRKKLGAQSAGLTPATAPARPPRAEELRSIPKKADPNALTPGAPGRVKPARQPEAIAGTPQASPLLGQPIPPQRPRPIIDPKPQPNPVEPVAKVPQVSVPAQPSRMERPANPMKPFQSQSQPAQNPGVVRPQRPPQTDTAPSVTVDENARAAEKAIRRQQREQQVAAQAQQNAQRAAEATRRQQEIAQRSSEIRPQPPRQQVQQADIARQQQDAAQRANDLREQQAREQRQQARQAEAIRQNQEAAQHANEMRNQQVQQQHQQARQAEAARQNQEAAQRANEMRQQQMQQHRQQAEAVHRQQEATQRASEMHHQQAPQIEVARRQQPPPQPQVQQPAQTRSSPGKDGDDEKKKHRGGR